MSVKVLKASDLLAEYTFDGNSAAVSYVNLVVDMGNWIANTGEIDNGRAEIEGSQTPVSVSLTGGVYHQFSFTVQNLGLGEFLNLTSISGQYSRDRTHSNESDHFFELYADHGDDGYTVGDFLGEARLSLSNTLPHSTEFDISTSALGDLNDGDVVGFRFYFADNNNHTFAYTHRLDNVQLHGAINSAIPEPASCALVTGLLAAGHAGMSPPQRCIRLTMSK
tara:strand:- start:1578 stop:2243 length:666 start_codon:yes stop_codon:yes gene_type:complete